jgi:aspartyl-tRNA(Asn)/glutamyl-tRNA(Gln) amidotransferase subunit B
MESLYIHRASGTWEMIIGLEVHAQIISNSKLFSGASTDFGSAPNSQVAAFDVAFPGMLPVLNKFCIEQAVRTGLALNATVHEKSAFDRKNYFYPDLPSGYQITQFYHPIVTNGFIEIDLEEGKTKKIRINRLHLEQDAGKSIHDQHPHKSYLDFNRAGVALMEIVSEPDIRCAEEAISYLKKLRSLLRYLGSCDGNMEEGSLRADVNISVRRPGSSLGTRAEIKNVNSLRFIGQAIEFEVNRQIDLLEEGIEVEQETRLFDSVLGETRTMRSKEQAHDYRYFPEPDLPIVSLEKAFIDHIRKELPELPDIKRRRFIEIYKLPLYDANLIVSEKEIADYFEDILKNIPSTAIKPTTAKTVANWFMGDFFAALNRSGLSIAQTPVSPKAFATLIELIETEVISGKIAKDVFTEMWETGKEASIIVETKGLQQISNSQEIENIIHHILQQNPVQVEDYRNGKDKLFGFFIGLIMKKMAGKGNPALINSILHKLLEKSK